jgi:hypothetical protein
MSDGPDRGLTMRMRLILPSLFLFLAFLLVVMPQYGCAEESGGTNGTKIYASTNGSISGYEIHQFVLEENEEKIAAEFSVTIYENMTNENGSWIPAGHIFGEIQGIRWDDKPEPTIDISTTDFEKYKQSRWNLTLFMYGTYTNASNETRFAFKQLTITQANIPPVMEVWVAEDGNWSWLNLSELNNIIFFLEDESNSTLWFNVSRSWDPDGKNVFGWEIYVESSGWTGSGSKAGRNESWVLDGGRSYFISGKIIDERGLRSEPVNFTIHVRRPEPLPDLIVEEMNHANKNYNKKYYETGDMIILQPKIKNVGENVTAIPFTVLFEYSVDGGESYQELERMNETDSILPENFELITYDWNTASLLPGVYIVRVTADSGNVVNESIENNNTYVSENITIEHGWCPGPDLRIEKVWVERTLVFQHQESNLSITVKNTGHGTARYVDIHYSIDDEHKIFRTLKSVEAGSNETMNFTFSMNMTGSFDVLFVVKDDGIEVERTDIIPIEVIEYIPPQAAIEIITPNPASEGETITFRGNGSGSASIKEYHWKSSRDGFLDSRRTFSLSSLSIGTHEVYFKVKDELGNWSDEISIKVVISNENDEDELMSGFTTLATLLAPCGAVILRKKEGK